jgi:membrane protease YdiL (CAAX protease family)
MFSSNASNPVSIDAPAESGKRHHSRARIVITILVLIIFQLPLGYLVPGKGFATQVGQEGVFWALTFILVAFILFIEHRPISSIGLKRPTWKGLAFGLAGAIVMVAGFVLIYMVVFPALGLSMNEAQISAVKSTPLWFRILLVVRASVFEEIYYRGFAIERLTEITGFRWLASLISVAAFTFAHLSYWGWGHLIVAAFGGAVLTGLYLFRRDLGANMVAHFVTDGVGFLVG